MNRIRFACVLILVSLLSACGGSNNPAPNAGGNSGATLPDGLIITTAPADAKDIHTLKTEAKEGDEVVMRGVVGGDVDPFVANRAILSLIDHSIPTCKDNGESCPTPWDYCCVPQEELTKAKATVQIVDAQGQVLKIALNAGEKIKPHQVIIVKGKVGPRPDPQVLTILATAVYVQGDKTK